MTYFVNPMWFYWLNVMEGIQILLGVLLVISAAITVVGTIVYLVNEEYGQDDPDYQKAKMVVKKAMPVLIGSALLLVFLPTKQTLIEMQVAKYATVENAEWTVEAVKGAVDYIVEAMKSIK